jgi:hypothetical protein
MSIIFLSMCDVKIFLAFTSPNMVLKMTFQEIRIIATGPCIANQLRDVNTICRRSWYIAAHVWKIYDFKIEVVPLIINFSTELTTVVKMHFHIVKMYKDKEVKNVKNFFVNVWRKSIFDIYVTKYGTALTTILPILFLYLNTSYKGKVKTHNYINRQNQSTTGKLWKP